jgi:hypothetical protein
VESLVQCIAMLLAKIATERFAELRTGEIGSARRTTDRRELLQVGAADMATLAVVGRKDCIADTDYGRNRQSAQRKRMHTSVGVVDQGRTAKQVCCCDMAGGYGGC